MNEVVTQLVHEPDYLFCATSTWPFYNLPDSQLIEELRRLKGKPQDVLQHPELMGLMLSHHPR